MKLCMTVALVAASLIPVPADAPLLPDLRQAPVGCPGGTKRAPDRCTAWDVCMVADPEAPNGACVVEGPIGAVRLRFTTSADNVGDGPLLIHARRGAGQPTMVARQAFQSRVDGPIPQSFDEAQWDLPTSVYYEPAEAHRHWHLAEFERFQLRTAAGQVLVADRKNGFCLGDRYEVRDVDSLPNAPRGGPQGVLAEYLLSNRCKHGDPGALEVTQGISVGSGDDYEYRVDFQWLDITRVPSGVYDVLNVVNGARTLREKSYDNNVSSIAISVRWPGGGGPPATITAAPQVELVRSCPGRDRCARS